MDELRKGRDLTLVLKVSREGRERSRPPCLFPARECTLAKRASLYDFGPIVSGGRELVLRLINSLRTKTLTVYLKVFADLPLGDLGARQLENASRLVAF